MFWRSQCQWVAILSFAALSEYYGFEMRIRCEGEAMVQNVKDSRGWFFVSIAPPCWLLSTMGETFYECSQRR